MRNLIYLWIGLTLVLGICGDDMEKRAAEDDGSGSGLPIDDEDYDSSLISSYGSESTSDDYGSGYTVGSVGSSSYDGSMTPSEDNFIKFRGEFTIRGMSGGILEWAEALSDSTSNTFREMSNLISPMIQRALERKKATKKGLQSVKILSFRHGSVITEFEASYSADSSLTADELRRSLKEAISNRNIGKLEIDPASVSVMTVIRPQGVISTDGPVPTEAPAVKTTTISTTTTSITTRQATKEQPGRSHKTDPPMKATTQSNHIQRTPPNKKPDPDKTNNDVINIDEQPTDEEVEKEEEKDNEIGNTDGREDNPETKTQNFWEKLFSHPLILAGLVGAVVIALLTVVLLLMFIVYRIKKKDEGSYSLDEPHKVKDPMAYWKDTKEFYA